MNNKGFVLIETIIVMSILAIGLISLYASFSLIIKKTQNLTNDSAINTYLAYQINNYDYYESSIDETNDFNKISNPYFIEIYRLKENYNEYNYSKKECGIKDNKLTCVNSLPQNIENSKSFKNLNAILYNLDVDKVYYFVRPLKDIFKNDVILLFDGSTIEYLNKIKNDIYIDANAERTIIVKTKHEGEIEFSYYQKKFSNEYKNIRKVMLGDNHQNVEPSTFNAGKIKTDANYSTLESIMDDYGISYYYRGNPTNNYLIFSGMCWRIVRITGNGNIKLVLFNEKDSSCNESNNAAFARIKTNNYISKFNSYSKNNTYIGYMYSSTTTANSYELAHNNDKNSTILNNLVNWYNIKFNEDDKKVITDTIWCNDKSLVTDNSYNAASLNNPTNIGIGKEVTYYQTTKRLKPKESAEPTLVCGSTSNILSRFTAGNISKGNGALNGIKIGLLTADEVAFAGSVVKDNDNDSAKTNYLYKNAEMDYWTLSPAYFDGVSAYVWAVNSNGILEPKVVNSDVNTAGVAVRPSITISSNVNVLGDGTQSNPYTLVY